MEDSDGLRVTCPCCSSDLVIDRVTGEVLSHRPRESADDAHDFDALLADLDEQKARAEAIFEREQKAVKDHDRLIEEKFRHAVARAAEEEDDKPPLRPFDLD